MAETVQEGFRDTGGVITNVMQSLTTKTSNSWLDNRYEGYANAAGRWIYTDDHYSGEVLQKLSTYLPKRTIAEHTNSYEERKKIVAYTPHLSLVIDSMAGMLQAVESDARRTWHKADDPATGLGDPAEIGTPAHRLTYNADGLGTNWRTFWNRVLINLLKYNELGIIVEGVTVQRINGIEVKSQPRLRIIKPQSQTNRLIAGTMAVERVIRHTKDMRESVRDESPKSAVEHYTVFDLFGWTEYMSSDGKPVETASDVYTLWENVERTQRTLPIVWATLPMDRDPAYMAARMCNRIFNTESEQQMATRMGNIPWPVFSVKDDKEFNAMLEGLASGKNAIPQHIDAARDHHYMVPPPEPAEVSREQIKQYREDFYKTTFQNYVDSVRSSTATEIRQKSRSGIEALLVTLSDALDTAEQSSAFLLEQAEFPDEPRMWGHFSVDRSKKFQPLDAEQMATFHKDLFFGSEPVPIGATGKANVAKRIADDAGIIVDDDELEQSVQSSADRLTVEQDARRAFGL